MLRVSKLADYAVVILACLAEKGEHTASARELAALAHVPLATASKVLKLLAQAELVTATRGIAGGYHLNRAPHAISFADIIAAIDGKIALTECGSMGSCCVLEQGCVSKRAWHAINHTVQTALQQVSLAAVVSGTEN